MSATSPAVITAVDRSDPAALLASLQDELDAIDLTKPWPDSVVVGTAIASSNGDGIEPNPLVTKLMVLAERDVITSEEGVAIIAYLHTR